MTHDSLTPLDMATGMVLPTRWPAAEESGIRPSPQAWPTLNGVESVPPRKALEREILPALLRPPCLVSFSGGLDSSAVLATATALARREGLPLPIPATNVFPSSQDADEARWQEETIRHLGLSDWIRVEPGDDLDLIGPYAHKALARHGLLWPANAHFHMPLLEAAPGGSMLTGVGGDELYCAARQLRVSAVLRREVRPRRRDLLSLGLAYAPRPIRRRVLAKRSVPDIPWLRPSAKKLVTTLMVDHAVAEPRRVRERMAWWRQFRYLRVGTASLDLLARDTDTRIVHPLLSEPFWSGVAVAARPTGFPRRADCVRRLFGDLLPQAVIERTSKAAFDEIFWTDRTRAFARSWDGTGVPHAWVDPEALARHWCQERPVAASSVLLQSAWLASVGHGAEQMPERVLH